MATAAKKSTVRAVAKPVEPQETVSMRALTPLRVDGLDVAEQEVFDIEVGAGEDLVRAGLAEAAPADPAAA